MSTHFEGSTFCIHTFGCQMNKHDSERVAGMLEGLGSLPVASIEEADIVVFLTCCVREAADTRLYGQVASMKNISVREGSPFDKRYIAVGGCIGQRDGEKLTEQLPHLDVVFGTHNLGSLPGLLSAAVADGAHHVEVLESSADFPTTLPTAREHSWAAWLPITVGCDNFCSYCIVPYTRGRERSRPLDSILRELSDLHARGYKEVTLLGQNVNSYRFVADDGTTTDFAALLSAVATAAPDMRVRFTTSHPKDMSDTIIDAIAAHPNICRHIHLPVQSGSNSVLKAMNRKYTREWYLDRIAAIRSRIPDCGISTDLFTGFHGESDEDFEQTLELMREVGFDSSFMFKYSERPGTLAARTMPDNISEDVKIERLNRMIALQGELSLSSNKADIGKVFDVLVEGVAKRSKEQMVGRTSQNKTAVFPRGEAKVGQTVRVEVIDATSATLICRLA